MTKTTKQPLHFCTFSLRLCKYYLPKERVPDAVKLVGTMRIIVKKKFCLTRLIFSKQKNPQKTGDLLLVHNNDKQKNEMQFSHALDFKFWKTSGSILNVDFNPLHFSFRKTNEGKHIPVVGINWFTELMQENYKDLVAYVLIVNGNQ